MRNVYVNLKRAKAIVLRTTFFNIQITKEQLNALICIITCYDSLLQFDLDAQINKILTWYKTFVIREIIFHSLRRSNVYYKRHGALLVLTF